MRRWAQQVQPATVSPDDWELLRLVTVEGRKIPSLVKSGLRAEAIQKRIERARRAARAN